MKSLVCLISSPISLAAPERPHYCKELDTENNFNRDKLVRCFTCLDGTATILKDQVCSQTMLFEAAKVAVLTKSMSALACNTATSFLGRE